MTRNVLKPSAIETQLELLLVLLLGVPVLAVCPSMCSCSSSHREVNCSWRGLRQLPDGLQHNLHSLNLSHNRFHNLDGKLSAYANLRILDLSHNRLGQLPTGLPRSLWQLYATANRIRLLDKNDTAYQWNLRLLELSNNKLERAVFINNTLTNLRTLNLSHNQFWTVPTNMPMRLETVDLSHNSLVQVLPGSLDRLPRLTHLHLHSNRFSTLPLGAFDQLAGLKVITLGDTPWACHLRANISYLLSWIQQTPAHVLGCPCHTQPSCGKVPPGRTGGWHFASYNVPPLAASAQDLSSTPPGASATGWWYLTFNTMLSTTRGSLNTRLHPFTATPLSVSTTDTRLTTRAATADHLFLTESHFITDTAVITDTALTADSLHPSITDTPIATDVTPATERFSTTQSVSISTKKTTTLRTRSVRRPKTSLPSGVPTGSLPFIHHLWLLPLILQRVL